MAHGRTYEPDADYGGEEKLKWQLQADFETDTHAEAVAVLDEVQKVIESLEDDSLKEVVREAVSKMNIRLVRREE